MKSYPLGINIIGGAGLSHREHIALIAATGWKAFFSGWEPSRTEAWANDGARHGLTYASIHAPFGESNLPWEEGEEGDRVIQSLVDCVYDCAHFDIPVMVLHPFIGFKSHTPTQLGLDRYARVVEAAEATGVRLAFENVEGEEYLTAIMQTFRNCPSVGFCYDSGHELCYNRGKDMLALYGDCLFHTHLNDNLGVTGEEITWLDDLHLVMGDGVIAWDHVMERISKTPFQGPLMCELSVTNKPGKSTNSEYAAMGIEKYYAFAYERARSVLGQ